MTIVRKPSAKTAAEISAPALEAALPAAATEFLKPFADMQENVRAGTEKNVEQLRTHYSALKDNAETATGKLEESLAAAHSGTREFNVAALEFVRAQANVGFAHLQALVAVKSIGEAVKLNQDFAKAQFETLHAHSKTVAELAKKVAGDVAEPVKAAMILPFKK